MKGITRYHIKNPVRGNGAHRFEKAALREPQADAIYRLVLDRLGMSLLPGTEHIDVSLEEWEAGYDRFLGIDVHLRSVSLRPFTVQEKFLFEDYHDLTVEYMQDYEREIPGDWFNLRAQLYFCGYDRHNRGEFDEWALVNWPALQIAIEKYRINFIIKRNGKDGARASLACINFRQIPNEAILAIKHYNGEMRFNHDWYKQMPLVEE